MNLKVLRGGAWYGFSDDLTCAAIRNGINPQFAGDIVGFRIVHLATTPKVLRGGSWYSSPDSLTCAFPLGNDPLNTGGNVGFRVVRPTRYPAPKY